MTNKIKDRRIVLFTLWIFVIANYIFCDVLSHMDPKFLKSLLEGDELLGSPVNDRFLFLAAVFMEIPFVMILLSRLLSYRPNRIANIIAGAIMTGAQIGSLFVGDPQLHYTFYSIIEIGTTLFIIWYAWTWKE